MWCVADNYNYMVTCEQKNFKIRILIKQLFTGYQILTQLPHISYILKNRNF